MDSERDQGKTDWARLRRLKDAEIDYSDAPPMNRDKRKNLRIRLPDGRRIPVKPFPRSG